MTSTPADPIRIHHYSDMLCVWAYVAEIRMEELNTQFGAQVDVDFRFVEVFGDTRTKLSKGWDHRGGAAGYADHVAKVVSRFEHSSLHPKTWREVVPASSAACHLAVCAVRNAVRRGECEAGSAITFASALRHAFFAEARDISSWAIQAEVLEQIGVPKSAVTSEIESGRAHAALASDRIDAKETNVRVSPTLVFNDGRQQLAGNVGYLIIEANIRELMREPGERSSWC